MPIPSSNVLLDKGVVRRAYEARVRLVHGRKLTPPHQDALDMLEHLSAAHCQVFITQESANLLRLRPPRYTRFIQAQASTLYKGR